MIAPGLLEAASLFLGVPLRGGRRLDGGYEADVFLSSCDTMPLVLHLSPAWRTVEELEWVHSVVSTVREEVPEAVGPVRRRNRSVFEWNGRGAVLFPYVSGTAVPRGHPELVEAAARLLARIHRALGRVDALPRPPRTVNRPQPVPVPRELQDAELDAWWERLGNRMPTTGLIHGDYYGGNLLADDNQVVGVLDWHEMEVRQLALEVAGASYEFCRNDAHELDDLAAQRFVATYRASGGPLAEWEWGMIPEFRAWWVRQDALRSLSYGPDGDLNYARKQMRAFHALRGRGQR